MGYKKPIETKVKVGKLDFVSVARKSGLTGISTKKFRDNAAEALHKSGFNKSDIKGILSGSRKMEQATLKNVFNTLRKADLSYKGGGAVKEYVTKEKNRQLGLIRLHLRERADEIKQEAESGAAKPGSSDVSQAGSAFAGSESANSQAAGSSMSQVKKIEHKPEIADNNSHPIKKSQNQSDILPPDDAEIKSLVNEAESHDLPID